MKTFKKEVLPLLLALLVLLGIVSPMQVSAGTDVIGKVGSMGPGDPKTGTGGGIVDTEHPIFVVGYSKEDYGSDKLPPKADHDDFIAKTKSHYKNHFGSTSNGIFFAPPTSYAYHIDAGLSWYSPSSGELNFVKGSDFNSKFRPIGSADSGHLWYTELLATINTPSDPNQRNRRQLAKKWEQIASRTDKTAQALKVWSWILASDGANIDSRLNAFLMSEVNSNTQAGKNQQTAAWVDLMISLWLLAPSGSAKEDYATEIERYLTGDEEELTKRPSLITVATAIMVHAPRYDPEYIVVRSVDYLMYLTGVAPVANMYSKDAGSRAGQDYIQKGHLELIRAAVNDSLKALPKRRRLSDLSWQEGKGNAFVWGQGGVDGRLQLTGSGSCLFYNSSIPDGFIKALKFSGNLYGFVVATSYDHDIISFGGRFGIRTNAPETVVLEPANTVIGQEIKVNLEMKQSGTELSSWKSILDGTFPSGYPQIKIDLKRTAPTARQADSTSPSETATNPYFNTTALWKGNNTWIPITPALLRTLLVDGTPVIYQDNTMNYPLASSTSIEFDYTANVQIKVGPNPEDLTILRPDPGTAKKIFKHNPPVTSPPVTPGPPSGPTPTPTPVKVSYISEPSYWSEIKNGSPGNETFEAMAGVPTTRNLYFASGGSEFIVETELEYVQDTETTRTYRSFFSGGVDSEFKAGDTAPNQTIGGQTVELHNGGTYTKTWTGSIPNKATAVTANGTGSVTATCSADPDYTAYDAAKEKAEDYVTTVRDTTLSFTSASDRLERKHDGWNVHISIDNKNPPQTTSATSTSYHSETTGTPPNQTTTQVGDPVTATASPSGAGNFTITVTFTVPAHIICGPCCTHVLPSIEDTWTQKVKYDHMKINVARVWKLDQAAVNGMVDITGTDEYKATVVQGDPTIFVNIADKNNPPNDGNDSRHGRLRYSVEPNQHDTVVWDEGPRSNKEDGLGSNGVSSGSGHSSSWATGILYSNGGYTNEKDYHRNRGGNNTSISSTADAKDVATTEWARFNQRRTTQNVATVISDMLILQTSSGDQSIFYFQKDSTSRQTQENFDKVTATVEEMWDNNPLSFARKLPGDINIGSYNGKFYSPATKYSSYRNAPVVTKFDTVPAGMVRTARPSSACRLVNTNIDIIDTIPNGTYITGTSSVFYKNILNYGEGTPFYDILPNTHFAVNGAQMDGAEFTSTYSDSHSKINDIVIHDPVSAEFAMVIPLDSSRDQRTQSTKLIGGNLQEPTVENVKRLKNPTPRQNLIWNGDAEQVDAQGILSNWKTWESNPGNATFTRRTTPDWKISGASTFEIITNPNANFQGIYYTDVPGIGGDAYSFTGKLGAHRCQGYFYIAAMDSSGTILGSYTSGVVNNNAVVQNLSVNFTAPAGTTSLRIDIVKGNTSGYIPGYAEYVFADDLVLYDNTTTTWQSQSYTVNDYAAAPNPDYAEPHTVPNPDYVTPYTIPNPDYIPASTGTITTFDYTGGVQSFTASSTGVYTLEVWGAQGGMGYNYGPGGQGGYAYGQISLNAGETIYIYVGGMPQGTINGGWNGGGTGSYSGGGYGGGAWGGGGGGATDIRRGGQDLQNRIIVAGGGGGTGHNGQSYYSAGVGGGLTGGNGGNGAGATQTSGYALGQGESASYNGHDLGAGGGGYYGGRASTASDAGGGGGSGYIGGLINGTMSSGVRSGNGTAKITAPTTPAVGSPTITVNNAHYIPPSIGVGTTFNYTGGAQTFTAPVTGIYTLETWGAQGGSGIYGGTAAGGYGGYSKGTLTLSAGETIYIYVGGQGASDSTGTTAAGGWNGGGSGYYYSGGGGGATDIRRSGQALSNRIIVAGGGGGGQMSPNQSAAAVGGAGGDANGGNGATHGYWSNSYYNYGGSQSAGGTTNSGWTVAGSLGQGGNYYSTWTGGGGGGYYGGAAGGYHGYSGAGGSGYIGGVTGGTMLSGVWAGNGMAKVYMPATAGQGVPYIEGLSPTILVNNAHYVPAVINPGTATTFSYTGGVQSFTAPAAGTYTLETWGAQGGGANSYNNGYGTGTAQGGYGGYSKGTVTLAAGETICIYVGGQGGQGSATATYPSGGWNGGGNAMYYGAGGGGGATDIRRGGQALANRILVAGGGGGAQSMGTSQNANGGTGGGNSGGNGYFSNYPGWSWSGYLTGGGTQSAGGTGNYPGWVYGNGSLGQGGNAYSSYCAGGGGGYYGGASSAVHGYSGAGGSGYIGGVSGGTMSDGIQAGNGLAKITSPGTVIPAQGVPYIEGLSPTIQSVQPVVHTITTAPEDWYETVAITIPAAQPVAIPGAGTFTPGNFINLDYGFQIYFPNRGNFFGDNSYGIANLTANRGRGFVDNMDTTEWTKEKYVVFDFNTIYNGVAYVAGQDIPLDIHDADGIYDFYCPLANYEAVSAEVTFKVIATNGGGIDNVYAANKERYGYFDARHSGVKKFNIDVVGRIGNLIMEDSGDFRFANLFKLPKSPVSWIVPNVVKEVELDQQNRIFGSQVDIRGEPVSAGHHWLNTYGLSGFAERDPAGPLAFPITPDKNNIRALRSQPLRVGYKSYLDIQTLGNYSNGSLQIIPYYYRLDLNSGETKQVDIYMNVNGEYKPINIFGAAVPGWNPDIVYNNPTVLNWDDESVRRNYTSAEQARTNAVAAAFQVYDTYGNLIDLPTPMGSNHVCGNNQILQLDGRNRTFIGTSTVYGSFDANPGDVFQDILFGEQGQRWHFTAGLPSSAVAVEHGAEITQANIDALRSNTAVLLMALDIKAVGDTYILQYNNSGQNSNIVVVGTPHDLSAIPYPIVSVMSITKSAADDMDVRGTH